MMSLPNARYIAELKREHKAALLRLQAENAELRTTLNMVSGGEHYTGIEEQVCLCGTCRFIRERARVLAKYNQQKEQNHE